jgi:hypothetical protein
MKGWVNDLVMAQRAVRTGHADVTYFSAPAFHQAHSEFMGRKWFYFRPYPPFGQGLKLIAYKGNRPLHFKPADKGSCENIARIRGGNVYLSEAVYAGGKIESAIYLYTARPGRDTDHAKLSTHLRLDRACIFKAGEHRGRVPQQLGGDCQILERMGKPFRQEVGMPAGYIEPHSSRKDLSPAETAAADEGRHVEKIAAYPAAEGRGWQIADVAGKCSEIAGMIGNSFQLERYPAE